MGAFYGSKIRAGKMTIDDVPSLWRAKTEEWLREHPEE